MTDKPKTKRRWLQFSLRTMLIVVTVFCVWLGITAKRAREQRLAVEAILELGAYIRYEHQMPAQAPSEPPGPEWLRRLIGDEYFFNVARLQLSGSKFNDASLAAVKRFPDLKQLQLYQTKVTDTGLVHLKGLTELQVLQLHREQITDAGLEHLRGLTKLLSLRLGNTQVTDEGVKKLQQALPNCKISH